MDARPQLIAVMGPTGIGKSDLAERLATSLDAILVNADAFMVYRGFDIGTNKPEDREKYELIDIRDPDEAFGVGEWVGLTLPILETSFTQSRSVVVVGGTGLNIRSLFEEYAGMQGSPDPSLREELVAMEREHGLGALAGELARLAPEGHAKIDLQNPARVRRALEKAKDPRPEIRFRLPDFRKRKLGLTCEPGLLENRLSERIEEMFEKGWADEVRWHLSHGISRRAPAMRAIGYDTMCEFVGGSLTASEAKNKIVVATRQYAKRQRTWLRSEKDVTRLSVSSLDEAGALQLFEEATETLRL